MRKNLCNFLYFRKLPVSSQPFLGIMKYFRTYSTWLVAAFCLLIGFVQKINKQDFYHHYFRTIAEIHVRNSHSVAEKTVVYVQALPSLSYKQAVVLFLDFLDFGGSYALNTALSSTYFQDKLPAISALMTDMRAFQLFDKLAPPRC